jgi:protein-tyrosine phosphatase
LRSLKCPYWVEERVAGCHLPCPAEAKALVERFTHFIILVEEDEVYECWSSFSDYIRFLEQHGVTPIHFPVPDMGAPDADEACQLIHQVISIVENGGRVLFHCYAGRGRTGIMLAAYLVVSRCMSWYDALAVVRAANPYAGPQSYVQEVFLDAIESTCSCRRAGLG